MWRNTWETNISKYKRCDKKWMTYWKISHQSIHKLSSYQEWSNRQDTKKSQRKSIYKQLRSKIQQSNTILSDKRDGESNSNDIIENDEKISNAFNTLLI